MKFIKVFESFKDVEQKFKDISIKVDDGNIYIKTKDDYKEFNSIKGLNPNQVETIRKFIVDNKKNIFNRKYDSYIKIIPNTENKNTVKLISNDEKLRKPSVSQLKTLDKDKFNCRRLVDGGNLYLAIDFYFNGEQIEVKFQPSVGFINLKKEYIKIIKKNLPLCREKIVREFGHDFYYEKAIDSLKQHKDIDNSPGKKYKFKETPIYFMRNSWALLFAHQAELFDGYVIFKVTKHKYFEGGGEGQVKISKDGIFYEDKKTHFFSYYTKHISKFQDEVRCSSDFHDLIKKYCPNFSPPFITPESISKYGWKEEYSDYYREYNIVEFYRGDEILLFNFNKYEATFYKNKKEINKSLILSIDDLDKFK